jgi:hypothetical protein
MTVAQAGTTGRTCVPAAKRQPALEAHDGEQPLQMLGEIVAERGLEKTLPQVPL